MALVNYSCSSSDEEQSTEIRPQKRHHELDGDDTEEIPIKRHFLPKALNKLGASKIEDSNDYNDDITKHEGRIRSFKHERGNWATHIYIPVKTKNYEEIQELCTAALRDVLLLHSQTELHLSLSKTVVLQHHLIDSFSKSLERSFDGFSRFTLCFGHLKIYTNEEKTRTFVGLKVDDLFFDKLLPLMRAVDDVMQEYKLSTFYEDPSFHVSLLWTVGNQVEILKAHLTQLNLVVKAVFEQTNDAFVLNVNAVHCKTGNKNFVYELK